MKPNKPKKKTKDRIKDEIKGRGNLSQWVVNLETAAISLVSAILCFAIVWFIFGRIHFLSNVIALLAAGVVVLGLILPNLAIEVPTNQIWVYEDTWFKTVRPVREGMHFLRITERKVQPNWLINLQRDKTIKNEPNERYKTADGKWVEIEWDCLITQNRRYPINSLNHELEETAKIFHNRITHFLTGYCAIHNADHILGKAPKKDALPKGVPLQLSPKFIEFQDAFRNQFSGSNDDDLEVKYGVWTNEPQLGLVRPSQEVQKSDEARAIVLKMNENARILTGELVEGEDGTLIQNPNKGQGGMEYKDAVQMLYNVNNPDKVNIIHFQNAPTGNVVIPGVPNKGQPNKGPKGQGKDKQKQKGGK